MPLEIASTVKTVYVTCTQMALHVHKFLCMILIPLCKNNLNLPMCYFFLPCAWLPPPLVHHVVMLPTLLHCTDFDCFFVFTEVDSVAQP